MNKKQHLKVLFLDDRRERWDEIKPLFQLIGKKNNVTIEAHWVETVEQCIWALNDVKYDYIYLDHDLGGTAFAPSDEKSGYEVAKWMRKHLDYKPQQVVVHSHNPNGARNMVSELKKFGATHIPFYKALELLKSQ